MPSHMMPTPIHRLSLASMITRHMSIENVWRQCLTSSASPPTIIALECQQVERCMYCVAGCHLLAVHENTGLEVIYSPESM